MARRYEINEFDYYFNYQRFNELFTKNKGRKLIGDLEQELADSIHVSKDAVHSWRNRVQSPNDLDIIKNIANYYKLRDFKYLLIIKGEKKRMNNFNELQINSIKRIYDSIIEHLDYFEKTDGYNDLWLDFIDKGIKPECIEDKLYETAEKELNKVMLCYKKEKILLKNTKVYEEIGDFIYNDLYDIFDGKLKYAYRFEAIPDGNPTTDDDYNKAMNKFNSIVDKYI